MGACRVARTELQRLPWHQSLVAQSWRSEWLLAHTDKPFNQGVLHIYRRRVQTERPCLALALCIFVDKLVYLLVGVQLVGAHIHHNIAHIGHHIVLRSGVYHRCVHHCCAEMRAYALKAIVANPYQVVQSLVQSIDALAPCGVSTLAVRRKVEHHKSLLSHSRLHAGRFSNDSHVDMWQQRYGTAYAVLARHFLLCRCQVYDVIACTSLLVEVSECLQQRHQSASAVVRAESVQSVAVKLRLEGVACPRRHWSHRVYVCVEQKGRLVAVVVLAHRPHVVGFAVSVELQPMHLLLHNVCCSLLVAACRGGGY